MDLDVAGGFESQVDPQIRRILGDYHRVKCRQTLNQDALWI